MLNSLTAKVVWDVFWLIYSRRRARGRSQRPLKVDIKGEYNPVQSEHNIFSRDLSPAPKNLVFQHEVNLP